jgi:hypothetical protein
MAESRIYTFFRAVPALDPAAEWRLVELWAAAWRRQGWQPVVLTADDVRWTPATCEMMDRLRLLPSVNPREYQSAVWARWLAVAQAGGGWMSDYDVIPYDFTPEGRPPTPGLMVWSRDERRCPCLVSGSARAFYGAFEMFSRAVPSAGDDVAGQPHLSDQGILTKLAIPQTPLVVRYNDEGWQTAPVVHYAHAVMPAGPRVRIVAQARPLPFEWEVRP